jgi:DNA polymerase
MNLYLDTETYSPVPLAHGLARYATQVEVMVVTWAIDEGPVHTLECMRNTGDQVRALLTAIDAADRIIAHNAQFDRTVLETTGWWPKGVGHKWYCTMAQALRHGLPGGLDKLSTVFKLDAGTAKLDGHKLVMLFCKPDKHGKRATRLTHPEEWKRFLRYAAQDIVAMRALYHKIPKWNDTPFELALWDLDQTINARGIAVDVEFATAAVRATREEQARLAKRTQELTEGVVERATQRDRLMAFLLAEHGVELPNMKADTLERRLEDPELPEFIKELLRLRLTASMASTSKYKRLLDLQVAGRIYHTLQYCGAQRTGRWAGRGLQPQNLYRPTIPYEDILTAIEAVKAGAESILLDDVMEAMASAIRSALVAGPGKKLVVSDLANIEGRILAWLGHEDWKTQAFRDYDKGTGPDLYIQAYARTFGVDPKTVTKAQRQIGKVLELAFGYEGGVGACVTAAATYGIDLEELATAVTPTLPLEVALDAQSTWRWAMKKGRTLGLSERVYVACEGLKRLWRETHPATVQLWVDAGNAARSAILHPGVEYRAGRLVFDRKGAWLRIRLPSGRYLLYPNPKLEGEGQAIKYAAWNVYKKCWHHEGTYGGKLVENACQGVARDVMALGMVYAEEAGFPVVLTVHDELVTEVDDDPVCNAAWLSGLLAEGTDWTKGLPLAAKGFENARYRKED